MTDSTTSLRSAVPIIPTAPVLIEHADPVAPLAYAAPVVDTVLSLDTDIASTTVSRPTLISWSDIPVEADLRMLDERMYSVGRTRVTLRLWRFTAGKYLLASGRDRGTQYVLELSGGGCRRKVLLGCDHASAVALCDRLTLARLSPLHLDDVLADGDLFDE